MPQSLFCVPKGTSRVDEINDDNVIHADFGQTDDTKTATAMAA